MAHAPDTLVRDWIGCWSAHDIEGLADYVAADYVHHMMNGVDGDLGAFQTGLAAVLGAFPDMTYTVTHVITDGDLVAAYVSGDGHHDGEFFGLAPTNRLTTFRGAYHCRVAAGKIAEDWDVFDLLTPVLTLGGHIAPDT